MGMINWRYMHSMIDGSTFPFIAEPPVCIASTAATTAVAAAVTMIAVLWLPSPLLDLLICQQHHDTVGVSLVDDFLKSLWVALIFALDDEFSEVNPFRHGLKSSDVGEDIWSMLLVVFLVGDGGHDDWNIFIVQYFVPIQFVDGTRYGMTHDFAVMRPCPQATIFLYLTPLSVILKIRPLSYFHNGTSYVHTEEFWHPFLYGVFWACLWPFFSYANLLGEWTFVWREGCKIQNNMRGQKYT